MYFLTGYLNHAASVQAAAAQLGLRAHMDMASFALEVRKADRHRRFNARFVGTAQGRLAYFDRLGPMASGFAGWLPYSLRRWEAATDKAAFKQHADAHGIPTPAACVSPDAIGGPFLIKKRRSSFGEGIRGPFVRFDPADTEQRLREGEYYENFILGHIAKAWYWGSALGAVELREPPLLIGNGRDSLRTLIEAVPKRGDDRPTDWPALERLARYCGIASLAAVPAQGREVLIDFKYASRYERRLLTNRNVIDKLRSSPLAAQFERAGEVFSATIADYGDEPCLFTLDAMIDGEGKVWFLEMNSNPMVHPDMYPLVLADLFPEAAVAAELSVGAS